MNKSLIMKISYCIVALLVAIAVVMNVVSVPVYASDVESLPALDEEINIVYDSDSVTINGLYDIPFKQDVRYFDGANYHYINKWTGNGTYNEWSDGGTPYYASIYTNSTYDGKASPFSYWYSPGQNRVYNFTGHSDCMKVESYANRVFHFKDTEENGHFLQFGYFDLNNMSYIPLGFVGNTSTCVLYLESGELVSCYTDIDGRSYAFPDDMVCVYSSYEISGFYEPDELSVFTPDYYFDYQYIYYVDGVGYTFIDSARPLDYISSVSGGTYAGLYFDEACNKHIYTSADGVNWTLLTTASSMYGVYFSVPYQWFYDSVGGGTVAILIYSNDDSYAEEPLLTPEYGDINDIIDSLYSDEYIKDLIDDCVSLIGAPIPITSVTDDVDRIANFGKILSYLYSQDFASIIDLINDEDYSAIKEWWNNKLDSSVYDNLTNSYFTRYELNDDGTFNAIEYVSLYSYVKASYEELYNLNLRLDNMQTTLHNDLKSVFDNITNTNTYLYDIKGLIQDMPDYSSKIGNVVNQLNNSNSSLNSINSKLDNIANSMNNGGTGSGEASPDAGGGSSSTTNNDITADFLVTLDDDMIVYLNDIKNISNKIYDEVDESLGEKIADDIIDEVLDDLFDDVADEDILADLFNDDFVQGAVASISTGTLITGTFSGITTTGAAAGVTWINSNITNLYNASSKVGAVLLLGVTMSVVGLVVRKGV